MAGLQMATYSGSKPGQAQPNFDALGTGSPSAGQVKPADAVPAWPEVTGVRKPDWQPYQDQWLETPLPFLKHMPRRYYRWRWMALYPLQWRLLGGFTTVGEVLLIALVLVIFGYTSYTSGKGFKLHGPREIIPGTSDLTKPNQQYVTNTGQIAQFPLLLTWILACHNSLGTFLFGIPFERALFWHKLMVGIAIGLGAYHGILGQLGKGEDSGHILTGWILEGIMGMLVLMSLWPVRRHLFEWFYRSHWMLFLLSAVFSVVHGAGAVLAGAAFWLVDILIRAYMVSRRNAKAGEIIRLPGNVIRIAWPEGDFKYAAGQYVFICVPAISLWEWHPFSLSSHPTADQATVHIRVLGDWTRRLYDHASRTEDAQPLRFFFEGPYGSPSVDVSGASYEMFLLFAGGIGITPMQSMTNSLMSESLRGRPLKKVWLVWSVRDKHLVESNLPHDGTYARKSLPNRLPTSFSPDIIEENLVADPATVQPQNPDNSLRKLHSEFYMTQVRDPSAFGEANIKPELQPYLRFGRPDLSQKFNQMRELAIAYGETKVAVMVCGPPSMISDVRRLSSKLSGKGVRFDCHEEVFEL